jgi:uncharacterized protein (TIGR03435 family)
MREINKWMWTGIGAVVVLALVSGAVQGQGKKPRAFEVASIKPNTPDGSGAIRVGIQPQPGGRLTVTNANLRMLIRFAYNIDDAQVSGGPSWMDSDRYDITAKAEGNPSINEQREMLQTLLAERFGLKFHRDSRELPVYALLPTRTGAKLKEVTDDSGTSDRPAGPGNGPIGQRRGVAMMIGGTTQIAGIMSMVQLSQALANLVGRKVVDKTGLEGNYDIKLEWTPQPGEIAGLRGLPAGVGAGRGDHDGPPPADPNGVSIFTAVQEQLGLRLESQKGPIDVLIIDSAVKPSEN